MTVSEFLKKHHQTSGGITKKHLDALVAEMEKGLDGKGILPMVPTYIGDVALPQTSDSRILIDIGGTNLRTAKGRIEEGKPVIEDIRKTTAPGSVSPMTAEEFYRAIAEETRRLAEEAGDVGFCFSYNVAMDGTMDGTVNNLAKNMRVSGIVGTRVGKSVLDQMAAFSDKKRNVTVFNDTVAALLGGKAETRLDAAYVGFIYGTGTNVCYEERTENIRKITDGKDEKMIINVESGKFDGYPAGDFENAVFLSTENPADYRAEKAVSGRYLPANIAAALQCFADEGGFAGKVTLPDFTLREVSDFLAGKKGALSDAFADGDDRKKAKALCRRLIDRAAKISATTVAAACKKTGGDNVAVVAEGTTFFRLTGFRAAFERYLTKLCAGQKVTVVCGEELNLKGALAATFVKR